MSLNYLPDNARVWVFTTNNLLTQGQNSSLQMQLEEFVADWKAHGNQLSAGFEILLDCIVLVAIDESFEPPSGCSIDKVFRLLTEFGNENKMDFFSRTSIIKKDNNNAVIYSKSQAEEAFSAKILLPENQVFNSMIKDLVSYRTKPFIPFSESWLGARLVSTKIA